MSPRRFAPLLLASVLLGACGADLPAEVPEVGEVRGASLSGFGRAEQVEGLEPAAPVAPTTDDLGLDYAEVLSPEEAEKYTWVDFLEITDFELESYAFDADGALPAELPADIAELSGVLVAVEGFMNPTEFDRDGVSQFTLVADPTFCCFGVTPTLHHFIQVDMPEGEFSEFFSIVPIAVFGRLEVGLEEEDGIALSFYRMRADHVFCVY